MANEVSSRVCGMLVDFVEHKGFPVEELLAGLPMPREQLDHARSRVSWDVWVALLQRAEGMLGSREALEEGGRDHARVPVFRWFMVVANTLLGPRELYRLGATLYGRSIFRNVTCTLEELSRDEIRVTLEIAPSYADSPPFFQLMRGALRHGPALMGLPAARVKMELSPRRASYTILLPYRSSLRARVLGRFRSAAALGEVLEELRGQHQELLAAHQELSETHAALQAQIAERERTESQLRQAQKLEAVGRLAAGIAHDFNNLLTVIEGYAEIALARVEKSDPTWEDLTHIKIAADRGSEVTRKLLAFGRTQVLKPTVLDLNRVVADISDVLGRLIEDRIELVTRPARDLGNVKADRSQLERALLNLVLNARDALPDGGTITIETANVTVEEPVPPAAPPLEAGEYVVLSVHDDGRGMKDDERERIFEPFYTTKDSEAGTGLGLSIVYGIAQQSDGHIAVSSTADLGTTIRLFFPRVTEPATSFETPPVAPKTSGGYETILLVEDDDMVRRLTQRSLEHAGYRVASASDGEEAVDLVGGEIGRFDLLVTDVAMRRMGGSELARQLRRLDSRLPVLFISGYPERDVLDTLGPGAELVTKPFTPDLLRQRVRRLLDSA